MSAAQLLMVLAAEYRQRARKMEMLAELAKRGGDSGEAVAMVRDLIPSPLDTRALSDYLCGHVGDTRESGYEGVCRAEAAVPDERGPVGEAVSQVDG